MIFKKNSKLLIITFLNIFDDIPTYVLDFQTKILINLIFQAYLNNLSFFFSSQNI